MATFSHLSVFTPCLFSSYHGNEGFGIFWTLLPGTQSNHSALSSLEKSHRAPWTCSAARTARHVATSPRCTKAPALPQCPARQPPRSRGAASPLSCRRLGRGLGAKGVFSARHPGRLRLALPQGTGSGRKLGDLGQALKPRSFFKTFLLELVTADRVSPPRAGCTPELHLVFRETPDGGAGRVYALSLETVVPTHTQKLGS